MRISDWSSDVCSSDLIVAEVAQREIPADQLMNVNVVEFDPNVPAVADQDKDLPVVPAVRKAEASYLAYSLRSTLEGTGQWGAVRVVPDGIDSSEVIVHGTILVSDGETLEIKIAAADATGRARSEEHTSELQSLMGIS